MADYNINAITRRVVFTGSAGLGPYAFSFEILDQDDLAVYFNATSLTITTDYTVTINANGTGSVNIVTGGSVPSTPTASDQIVIVGARDIERVTDFVTAGDLLASSLNEQLDALTIFDQQVAEENKRGLRAPVYDPALVEDGGVVDMTLPAKADRAGRFLAFDSNGNPTATTNVGDFKGDWAASTVYRIGDLVRDTTDDSIYRVNTDHTSSGSLPLNTNTNAAYYDLFVDLSDINASEAAAAASATEAEEWASKTNGIVDGTDYSSKAYALGGTGVTNTSGKGAAKEWATTTGGTVDTSEYSSKEYAIGTTVASGSAKDWASQASGTVDGSEYSAKYYSGQASTSASNAATSETNASNSASAAASAQTAAEAARDAALAAYDDFDDRYLGDFASNPTTDNDGDPLAAGMLYFNTTDDTMKVYTGSGWVAAYVSGTGFLATTGGTMTGDITFGDNDKAIFGAGSDLQIYHNGVSASYITDQGTGNLVLGGDSAIILQNSAHNANMLDAYNGGRVGLYHANSLKLATTATGVDVTGTITSDGLTVDTNTLYVDSTNNRVGIGTSSPATKAEIYGTASAQNVALRITNTAADGYSTIQFGDANAGIYRNGSTQSSYGGASSLNILTVGGHPITLGTSNTVRLTVDPSGNVGIGTGSPTKKISADIGLNDTDGLALEYIGDNKGGILLKPVSGEIRMGAFNSSGTYFTTLYSNNSEAARLDASGNFLVGTTSTTPNPGVSLAPSGAVGIGNSAQGSGWGFIEFRRSATQIGGIIQSGTTGVSYNTSSDYRLKENVVTDWDATTRLKQLNPVRFNFIADPDTTVDGFLAHEVQDIVPEAISGTKDGMRDEEYQVSAATGDIYTPAIEAVLDEAGNEVTPAVAEVIHSTDVERPEELAEGQQWRETTPAVMGTRSVPDYQGIDQSKLTPLLTKALIEAVEKIEQLEARITALEAN